MNPFVLTKEFVEKQIQVFDPSTKCDKWHEGSCNQKFLTQILSTGTSLSKLYLMVHLIPFLLKVKKIKKHPLEQIKKLIIGYIRSLLFAGLYAAIVRRVICLLTQIYGYHNYVSIPAGFLGGISLTFESPGRQAEIALYCMSKTMQTGWSMLQRRGYVRSFKFGDVLLFGVAIGILGYFYQNEKESIKPTYSSVITKLLGDI